MDLSRLALLAGDDALARMHYADFLVCGLGGVGAWAAEALARSGAGSLTLVDYDLVQPSNLNRQLLALQSTLGRPKVQVLAERLKDINPEIQLTLKQLRLSPENIPALLGERHWTGVLDAIDERQAKLALLEECVQRNLRVVSSLGAANMTRPTGLEVTELSQTSGSPLARIIRKTLRKQGIEKGILCVASKELPILCEGKAETEGERRPMGSIVTVTATAGFLCANALMAPLLQLETRPRKGE
ncbi:MAG: tRNA threonylcarbamoyladenosine dehydratase [Lentisphaeria bacterium]|nr:tRNA threonylcarbamoyladenosine dehydratase [Lentisphaeria bacterium]